MKCCYTPAMPKDTHSAKRPVITSHIHGSLRLTAEQSVIPHEYPPATTLTNQEPPEIQLSQANPPSLPTITPRSSHLPLIPAISSHSSKSSSILLSHRFFLSVTISSFHLPCLLTSHLPFFPSASFCLQVSVILPSRHSSHFDHCSFLQVTMHSIHFQSCKLVIQATRHLFQFQPLLFTSI